MYPAKFDYYRATTLEDALHQLEQRPDAKILAGGHSLIPMMKLRLAQPPALIDIGRIDELKAISEEAGRIRIGALVTHADLTNSELLRQKCPILSEAAEKIADRQVRNKGTVGGNLVHADPGSDLPAVVLALRGAVHISGPAGNRIVQAHGFFLDLLMTDLHPNEILTALEVPALSPATGSCYLKFENPASGYAVCGAAAVVRLNEYGSCLECFLCFNGITNTPLDAHAVGSVLVGRELTDEAIDDAINEQLSIEEPLGDVYASGTYRMHLARVYARRALRTARDRAGTR